MDRQALSRRLFAASAFLTSSMALAAVGGGGGGGIDFPALTGMGGLGPPPPAPPSRSQADERESSDRAAEHPQDLEDLLLDLSEIPLVLQAIVEPISTTAEGSIIRTIGPAWRALLRMLSKDPDAVRRLSPRQLEELIAASYEEEGFDEVTLTPRSGDLGRDVIAVKRGFCTVRIIDQVKHFAPNHRVTANDVRALVGVLLSDERATKGFVTTTSSFAPGIESDPFISKHVPFRLELVDGKSLSARLRAYHAQPKRTEA